MDKGIRPYCNAKFVELNNLRNRGELTNTAFRKSVMADVMENFGITLASAATHYNFAFKTAKELNSELVSGLGRADDKKGGRKTNASKVAAAVTAILGDASPTSPGALLANMMAAVAAAVETAPVEAAVVVAEQTYTVTRVKDGAVIATGLVLSAAEALVAKAATAKKAKLAFA